MTTSSTPETLSAWAHLAAEQPGTVLLATACADAENRASFLFAQPAEILTANAPEEVSRVFAAIERALRAGRYAAGFLAYEAGYHFEPAALRPNARMPESDLPLAWFGVYSEPAILTGPPDIFENVESPNAPECPGEMEIGLSRQAYAEKIDCIRESIAAGSFYQANLTVPLQMPWRDGAARLFRRVMANQPVPYGALLNLGTAQIVSASPELFFRRTGSRILVRPMKGTCQRGRDLAEDARNAAWLASDEKNRAENVMIVDLLRNDLGRICMPGSVRATELFHIERYPDLLQMTSTIEGELQPRATHYDVFRSLFPCGSITGAPKVRTMQAICELESAPRGIACGAIGYFSPNGDSVFSVAIRTAVLREDKVQLRVGSGITYDSQASAEYDECLLKARFLTHAPEAFELIETLRWENAYFLLEGHLDRLAASAEYFGFAMERGAIREQLLASARGFGQGLCYRVRLLLSRSGAVSLASEPIAVQRGPVSLLLAGERTDAGDPFLRHKTTRRAIYDRALSSARSAGFDDALFLNRAGEVTECAIHNLLIIRNGEILTPALDCGALPGVYRRWLMKHHPNLREAVLTLADLHAAERVYIFNSVRGLRRVQRIETASCGFAGQPD